MAHPRIEEVFFDFVQLDRTNSETVCKTIMECYTSRGIDLSKVRGQTYDTTSSMCSVGYRYGKRIINAFTYVLI